MQSGVCKQLRPNTKVHRIVAPRRECLWNNCTFTNEKWWAQQSWWSPKYCHAYTQKMIRLFSPPFFLGRRNRWRTSRTHRCYRPDCLHINACVLCSNNALFSKTTWQHSDRGIHFCYTKSVPFSTEHKPVCLCWYIPIEAHYYLRALAV